MRQRSSGIWWVLAQMHRYQQVVAQAQAQPGQVVRLAFINALGQVIELPYPCNVCR